MCLSGQILSLKCGWVEATQIKKKCHEVKYIPNIQRLIIDDKTSIKCFGNVQGLYN